MADLAERRRSAEALDALVALWSLVRSTTRLWRLSIASMGTWFCLGFAVHTLALLASARLGAEHGVLALVVFIVGVVATLVALVMMIHSIEPHLVSTRGGRPDAPTRLRVPGQVFVRERSVDLVASAIGPFLAVYAVWGFVEDQVREIFLTNYTLQGLGGIDNFSISFSPDRLRFYVIVAAVSWSIRQLVSALTTDRRRRPLALVGILAEAVWVFSGFVVLFMVARVVLPWIRTRAAWVGVQDGWQRLLEAMPDWPLPFGLTVPQALDRAVAGLVDTVLPGAWQAVALPLVWLALTATVLGWRQFGASDVLAGTRLEDRAARLTSGSSRTRALIGLLTGDLRTKYLPVLQALRLIGYAGPSFIGVYLVLATVLTAAQQSFDIGVTLVLGPRDVAATLLTDSLAVLVSGLIFTPIAIALYAAAFDQALGEVLGRRGRVSAAPRPDNGRRPSTAASAPGRRSAPGSDS